MQKILKKEGLNKFISSLIKKYEVIAPIKELESTKFSIVKNPKKINLKDLPIYSPKRFFLPEKEVLFNFKDQKISEPKSLQKQRIIFGIRMCDLNALLRLDYLFLSEKNYKNKRKNTLLIGIHCKNPIDEHCFCSSMELHPHFDLFFVENNNSYNIVIGSEKGEKLVKNLKTTKSLEVNYTPNCKKELQHKDFKKFYNNQEWEKLSEKCLSCAACTMICPTCPCFDINDEVKLDIKQGVRYRKWASCQLPSFTKVAGGKIFREKRVDRLKHFIFHKVQYFKEDVGEFLCIGCGRCIRHCPTRIDWVNQFNELK